MTDESYAAEIDENNLVVRVIVGSADWATANLGGQWIDSNKKLSPDWEYYRGDFRPTSPYPSWSWDGEEWQSPIPKPDGDQWVWIEDALDWVYIEEI